jgi:hypothetical protein
LAVLVVTAALVLALGFWWRQFKPADVFLAANPITSDSINLYCTRDKLRYPKEDENKVRRT